MPEPAAQKKQMATGKRQSGNRYAGCVRQVIDCKEYLVIAFEGNFEQFPRGEFAMSLIHKEINSGPDCPPEKQSDCLDVALLLPLIYEHKLLYLK